jgi:carboxymethylenebutenolidase
MSEMIQLQAADGHRLDAYLARPASKPRGGLVVIQEIFGVTEQMKRCTDHWAAAGYLAILPAMFDRKERGLQLGYGDVQKGATLATAIPETQVTADVAAAREYVASDGKTAGGTATKTAIMGFCWGGTIAYLAASQLPFNCAVSYYGGGIARLIERMKPKIPVMYHFGATDTYIPMATIDKIRQADPQGIFHVYEGAGHGFNCDDRNGYDPAAAELSDKRTREFLARHL